MQRPLVLDFDGGTLQLPDEVRVPLGVWQERIRFGCTMSALQSVGEQFETILSDHSTVFMGSGDFHHLSYLLIRRLARIHQSLRVLVLDNHPDNMRYTFGIHCGSWVRHVCTLPFVTRVDVVGIHSTDVEGLHVLENYLSPLRTGKLHYWCIGRELAWLRRLGARNALSFSNPDELIDSLTESLTTSDEPIYLSIDKDVLTTNVVQTNWDQGALALDDLKRVVSLSKPYLVGCDIVGEASAYVYRSRFKRFLSSIDGQSLPSSDVLQRWQKQHHEVNVQLLSYLS